jgi:DNA polymerase
MIRLPEALADKLRKKLAKLYPGRRLLFVDIESRSVVDLLKVGVYPYAEHPSTRLNCVSWSIDDGPVSTWYPWREAIPDALLIAFIDEDFLLVAHNASFERVMFNHHPGSDVGIPPTALDRWICTAALAASMGLPRALDGVCGALDLSVQKDTEGKKVMLKTCKPVPVRTGRKIKGETVEQFQARKLAAKLAPPVWIEDDETMDRLGQYCEVDVLAEIAVFLELPVMPASEREIWTLTEEMNDRGVLVDERLLMAVLFSIEDAEKVLNARLAEMTGGMAGAICDHGAITRWLKTFNVDDRYEDLGEGGVGKAALADMLERPDLPDVVRNVLMMRREGGKSSTAKYLAMLARMSNDGTIKGSLLYCGAAATGRWSGKGVQLQNLPNTRTLKRPLRAIQDLIDGATIEEIEELHGPVLVVASELCRPTFMARPDHLMVRGDSSQIEARILPWLAGAQWKLDAFRAYDAGTGPDLYCVTAAQVSGLTVAEVLHDKKHGNGMIRQAQGKTPELACGYGGWVGAFMAFAKIYGLDITEERAAEIASLWRHANPEAVRLWASYEEAAFACLQSAPDGTLFPAGPHGVGFKRNRQVMVIKLPSGRNLHLWNPRIEMRETPWGDMRSQIVYRGAHPKTGQWCERGIYGGKITAMVDQGTARDLMAYWLLCGVRAGLLPVLSVHDEGIFEAKIARFGAEPKPIADIVAGFMRTVPGYAAGLPVSSDASCGPRYLKAA